MKMENSIEKMKKCQLNSMLSFNVPALIKKKTKEEEIN